jgi:hypothetical protein
MRRWNSEGGMSKGGGLYEKVEFGRRNVEGRRRKGK